MSQFEPKGPNPYQTVQCCALCKWCDTSCVYTSSPPKYYYNKFKTYVFCDQTTCEEDRDSIKKAFGEAFEGASAVINAKVKEEVKKEWEEGTKWFNENRRFGKFLPNTSEEVGDLKRRVWVLERLVGSLENEIKELKKKVEKETRRLTETAVTLKSVDAKHDGAESAISKDVGRNYANLVRVIDDLKERLDALEGQDDND